MSSPQPLLLANPVIISEVNVIGKILFILPKIFKMNTKMWVSLFSHVTWDAPYEELSERFTKKSTQVSNQRYKLLLHINLLTNEEVHINSLIKDKRTLSSKLRTVERTTYISCLVNFVPEVDSFQEFKLSSSETAPVTWKLKYTFLAPGCG